MSSEFAPHPGDELALAYLDALYLHSSDGVSGFAAHSVEPTRVGLAT